MEKLKRHIKVLLMAIPFGLGAYAVIQIMMALSRWAGNDF